jgi:uncharacterized membrane protein (DUF106 family)
MVDLPPRPVRPPVDTKKQLSTFFTIFVFVAAMFVLLDNNIRLALGQLVGVVFEPLVGFNGAMPVVTLFLTGILMTSLTIIFRHFFTDYVKQAESQKIVSSFNKELRAARVENNKYKIKKLTEEQPKIMKKSMDMSTIQMKLMPVTMIIVIPIFAWLDVFMNGLDPLPVVNLPWATAVPLVNRVVDGVFINGTTVLPNWVLLYSLVSIPFGQILARSLRWYQFNRRVKEIEVGTEA